MAVPDIELSVSAVRFLSSDLTIIESNVVLSQFGKLIRDDRELDSLVIKFLKGGVLLFSFTLWPSSV